MTDPAELVDTLPSGAKVKRRSLRMRACSETDAKGKLCAGHLKRWYDTPGELRARYGAELYRCEKCHTVYLPHPGEVPRTGTLAW